MSEKQKQEKDKGITVKKEDDMPEWYEQVCLKAELAEFSTIKGCMVIRPNGYGIWENIQSHFNKVIKDMGVRNAYFPLFIPEHFFKKEAEHAEGFAPEVAWVTEAGSSKLDERLAIRPTSETIINDSYSRWIRSYRDLPLLINQWCNIVRWETKATKLFLRSREFLWQEGHCVFESDEQCTRQALDILEEYRKLSEDILAVPVLTGKKTEKEKFAGAKDTYAIEALMPDGKALQMGTSHHLGQGFMKAFKVRFLGKDEKMQIPYSNSWGISTRLIGGLVMTHSDDKGLVLPPKIAPIQAVIVPIIFEKTKELTLMKCISVKDTLKKQFSVHLDDRDDYSSGWKFNEWEMKGIPLRIEIGPKDIEKKQVVLVRRDNGEKTVVKEKDVKDAVKKQLDDIQKSLYDKALKTLKGNTIEVKDWKGFLDVIKDKKMAKGIFCGSIGCEDFIKDKTGGASSRVIETDEKGNTKKVKGKCLHCQKDANYEIYFSKSY
ncbi:MAG: proline--tRNA ligase [Candidatus Woesearchaeota archaeon]